MDYNYIQMQGSVNKKFTYFIYKSGSAYYAQTSIGPTSALISNSSFSTLFQDVINAISPAGTATLVEFSADDFVINAAITIPASAVGNIALKGAGMGLTRLLICSAFNSALPGTASLTFGSNTIIAAGNTGTPTENIALLSLTATMSGGDIAKFAADDYVLVKSSRAWINPPVGTSSAFQGEIKRVVSAASTTLTFDQPTFDTYTTADTAKIYKLSMLKNITIEGITIAKDSGLSSSATINFIDFRFVNNLRIDKVELMDNVYQYDSGLTLFSCINVVITNCHLIQNPSNTYNLQYGISIKACSQNVIISNCTSIGRFRHAFAVSDGVGSSVADIMAGVVRNEVVSNCVAIGGEVAAFDTHADGEMIAFDNCKVLGSNTTYGINIRNHRTKVINCSVHSALTLGFYFYENANECEVINCSAYNCGWYGLYFSDGVSNIKVMGGYYSSNADHGINIGSNSDYITLLNVSSTNNVGAGIQATDAINLTINNCVLFGNTASGISIVSSSRTLSNILICGNHLTGQSGTPLSIPASLVGSSSVILKDNLGDGITIADPTNFQGIQVDPLYKRSGKYAPSQGTTATTVGVADYMLAGSVISTGGGTNSNTFDTTEGLLAVLQTSSTSNSKAGLVANTAGVGIGRRLFAMRFKIRAKIDSTTSARYYFGVTSNSTLPATDTPIATSESGVIVGFNSSDTTYQIYTNNGEGSEATKTAVTGNIAKDTNFHTIEINWVASDNIIIIFDGTTQTVSTALPATTANLFFNAVVENTSSTQRAISIKGILVEADK
jgi:hypothetical protein